MGGVVELSLKTKLLICPFRIEWGPMRVCFRIDSICRLAWFMVHGRPPSTCGGAWGPLGRSGASVWQVPVPTSPSVAVCHPPNCVPLTPRKAPWGCKPPAGVGGRWWDLVRDGGHGTKRVDAHYAQAKGSGYECPSAYCHVIGRGPDRSPQMRSGA